MRPEADEAPDAAMKRKVMECMPGILRSRDSQDIIHQRPDRLRQPSEVVAEAVRLVRLHMQHPPQGGRELRRFLHRRREALPELIWLQLAEAVVDFSLIRRQRRN